MGFFSDKCEICGSLEHATIDCPHGFLSTKCTKCGSVDHATKDCPHGIFSSECSICGSKEHTSENCPHGLFSSKCSICGSLEHSADKCPHGIFSSKCNYCGSVNHSSDQCPHNPFSSKQNVSQTSSSYSSDESDSDGCIAKAIGIIIFAAVLIWFVFSVAIPLIIFNLALIALIAALFKPRYSKILLPISIISIILAFFDFNLGWFTETLKQSISISPGFLKTLLYINLIAGLTSSFFLITSIVNSSESGENQDSSSFPKSNYWIIGSLLLIGVISVFFQEKSFTNTHQSEKLSVTNPVNSNVSNQNEIQNPQKGIIRTKEGSDLRLRSLPNLESEIIALIPNRTEVEILGYTENLEIVNNENGKWCKVEYNGQVGWAWGGFIEKKVNSNIQNTHNNFSEQINDASFLPIANLFHSWEELDLNKYMNQWDINCKQISSKYEVRNYNDILQKRKSLFGKLSSVKILNYKIIKSEQISELKFSYLINYSMLFEFKNGKRITENDISEVYIIQNTGINRDWKIIENNDYLN